MTQILGKEFAEELKHKYSGNNYQINSFLSQAFSPTLNKSQALKCGV